MYALLIFSCQRYYQICERINMAFNSLKEKSFLILTLLGFIYSYFSSWEQKVYIYHIYVYHIPFIHSSVHGPSGGWRQVLELLSAHWWAELSPRVSGCPGHGGSGVAVDLLVGDAGAQVVLGLCSPHDGWSLYWGQRQPTNSENVVLRSLAVGPKIQELVSTLWWMGLGSGPSGVWCLDLGWLVAQGVLQQLFCGGCSCVPNWLASWPE